MLQPIPFTRSEDISTKSQSCDVPTNPAAGSDASSRSTTSSVAFGWWQTLWADIDVIFTRDPAARNWIEVLFCYPGLHALMLHRVGNWLYSRELPFLPRFLSHLGRWLTGIEIHPGATIGKGVFIDHGMGVVIGETAIVGDYCLIYQNVTLGGTGKDKGKRHPTLGDNVVVGTGASVLGNIRIGDRSRIGAGSVVLKDVPDNSTIVGIPGRIVSQKSNPDPLAHHKLPDVEAKLIRTLIDRIATLEQQVQDLKVQDLKEREQTAIH